MFLQQLSNGWIHKKSNKQLLQTTPTKGETVVEERILSSKEILFQFQNIRKRTAEGDEQHSSLSSIIKAVELSIREWRDFWWLLLHPKSKAFKEYLTLYIYKYFDFPQRNWKVKSSLGQTTKGYKSFKVL